MKKIGLFGGTFDPIHFGHLNLAFEIVEKQGLDEIWFIPAHVNPHKSTSVPSASMHHRLMMVAEAIQDIPNFYVKDFEANRAPPSYTFDTLSKLLADDKENQYFWIMGDDGLKSFCYWHKPDEIVKLIPLLIGTRTDNKVLEAEGFKNFPGMWESVQKGLIKTNLFDISSTGLRLRLAQGYYCGHLIPAAVLEYIQEHKLYPADLKENFK